MAFSAQWETAYRLGAQNSTWPWSDLISYVMRYARTDGARCRVLELGFGAGANVPFFLAIGAEYYGTEGSPTAVERARERFGTAENFHVACCDFTQSVPFEGPFDLVVDRSSLTHNGTRAIRKCLELVNRRMRSGGKFIGIDWFSTANADFPNGTELEDHYTRAQFPSGQFRDIGTVHFSDAAHLRQLLSEAGFQLQRLEHKQSDIVTPSGEGRMAWWHFLAEKP
jgi:SAM-dependent methyltransferase